MKNTKQLFIATALFLTGFMNAQVGIGTTTPAASAELDITSTTKGFLPPRMSNSQMVRIATPALGLTVYCTDCAPAGLYTNQSTDVAAWQHISNSYGTLDATGNLASTLTTFYNGWTAADPIGAPTVLSYSGTSSTVTHSVGQKFSDNATCAGKLISRSSSNASCPSTVTGLSGTIYPTVYINGQCWMKTNLKEIPSTFITVNTTTWLNTATSSSDLGYWGFYNTGDTTGATGFGSTELTNEGYLYQWRAAMNGITTERAQGACPTGWHIPSDCEFMYLEHGIGMSLDNQIIGLGGSRDQTSTTLGDTSVKLRNSGGAQAANNSSGFSLLMAGKRTDFGVFGNRLSDIFLWTSTIATTNSLPIMRYTNGSYRNINRGSAFKASNAISVRCLKD